MPGQCLFQKLTYLKKPIFSPLFNYLQTITFINIQRVLVHYSYYLGHMICSDVCHVEENISRVHFPFLTVNILDFRKLIER